MIFKIIGFQDNPVTSNASGLFYIIERMELSPFVVREIVYNLTKVV